MDKIEAYAAKLVAEGGESAAEDDLNESEEFSEAEELQWREATELGVKMAQAIGQNPEYFASWYRSIGLPDG
jgi:hypothetical protein